ncbi:type IV pilus biogenesis protein PilM [Tepidanaerobacter syntrophicus]|uniref:Type IV pilus assembly protein PilM n=1 Tax=Tepidanaerobacter syntrophicus TaxID=224999 RepID=A0A0U9HH26_9FIRM|nr:hypothetical protein [Tepidanaerobacter syntrophicus]GAQ26117.1 type IV pilus assembly protein PilM [Tepidanaerobacter syntrophicus]
MLQSSLHTGIDIGAKDIKIANVTINRRSYFVKNFYKIENPIGKLIPETPLEKSIMNKCFIEIKDIFSGKIIIGISSKYALFRQIQLPRLSKRELKEAIFWETQEFLATFGMKFISDYEVLYHGKNTCSILIAAVPEGIAKNYAKIALDAGIFPNSLDVYPLANACVIQVQKNYDPIAIIDLDFDYSEITILNDGEIILVRNLDFFNINEADKQADWENIDSFPMSYKNFIIEISRTFEFYMRNGGQKIEKIVIAGEGSKSKYCKAVLEKHFHVEVFMGAEFAVDHISANIKLNSDILDYFSAIGLALRGR